MATTFDRVRERFYWPGMKKDVHEWVSSCEVCCQKKVSTTETHAQPDNVETMSSALASRLGHYATFT